MASYDSITAPSLSVVYVDDVSYPMTLQTARSNVGIYQSQPFSFILTTPCSRYKFVFNSEIFPHSGEFYTYGAGACLSDSTTNNTNGGTQFIKFGLFLHLILGILISS